MTLNTRIAVDLAAVLQNALDLGQAELPISLDVAYRWPSGTTADKADKLWSDHRTINASSNDDLDLAGSLSDGLGGTITFARIKAMLVRAARGNANNVIVGGGASNQFINWVADATDKIIVRPGGLLLLVAPDATGYPVTASTGDILRVANSGAGSSVDYDIVLIGASA
ncbi:hypothetical protein [Dactylosporangium salmoneum]|uniref:PLAT domain-containing protein n=1 Tax=Dactylosporangium salmoneum TaxID=53361 RepID=A0ABN3FDQ7_9ACTN